jgi:glycerol-1-phosphate dehydrogenase [NAD(P)+]
MINIPIPAILMIRNDAISEMEEALRKYGFKKALFIFDDFTFDSFKNRVALKAIKADFFTLPSDLDVQN